jgi:hypothetical protein
MIIPESLKMPKPLIRYTKEEIKLDFFKKRIQEVSLLIQGRKEVKLTLAICLWLQVGSPKDLRELKQSVNKFESRYIPIIDLKKHLELLNEKINYPYLPEGLFEYFNRELLQITEPQSAEYIQIKPHIAKLAIQISLYLNSPIEDPWKFIEDVFVVPRPFISIQEQVSKDLALWSSGQFESLPSKIQDVIKLLFSMFEYFSLKFSGIREHFLKIASLLFWSTRLEPVYSLEVYELLTEMFGSHKLDTRSSQLYESGKDNELINCEKKGKNKNRAIIYFGLRPGAEWIITGFFPDRRLIIQQQAIAISFLRYSKAILTRPWTINSMNFNYLLDIWFRSFLYSDNLDQMVYEKAREHRRKIEE